MEDSEERTAFPLAHATMPYRRGCQQVRLWSIGLALTLLVGVGVFLGATLDASPAKAAPSAAGAAATSQGPAAGRGMMDQCGGQLTVSRVSAKTITVTRSDGSTATIHITSRTHYTRAGHAVAASAVTVGSKIYVVGACTGQGRSINATSIEIVN